MNPTILHSSLTQGIICGAISIGAAGRFFTSSSVNVNSILSIPKYSIKQ